MTKYNQSFKQQVIEFYLQNGKNHSLTRQHFQLARTTLERWIHQYNHNGHKGLAVLGKKRIYSPEFKLSVVQAVKNGQFSARNACFHFGIANSGIISQWLQAFDKQGINGLLPKPKGRPIMKPKYPKMPPPPSKTEGECHPKKVAGTQPSQNAEKAGLVKRLRNSFPLEILLQLIGLKRSTYFYHLADKVDKNAVIEQISRMMTQAIAKLNGAKPILHSDQGWQYQMAGFQNICQRNGITQSISRKGNCLDNGAMESFFGRLKTECYFGKRFESFAELKQTIHNYIHYYNNERIQVKLKGLSPVKYRTQSLN